MIRVSGISVVQREEGEETALERIRGLDPGLLLWFVLGWFVDAQWTGVVGLIGLRLWTVGYSVRHGVGGAFTG